MPTIMLPRSLWHPRHRRQLLAFLSRPIIPPFSLAHAARALPPRRHQSAAPSPPSPPRWRSASVLDSYVEKPARPISLRQLIFFGGRNLDEARILSSANYVRTELPVRLAHRIRDLQSLPYVVVTNRHLSHVYELYYDAFDTFRRVPEVCSLADNARFCDTIRAALRDHLTVIPRLAMGVLECRSLLAADRLDKLMHTLLRSRISRRVIAEQHLALTDTFLATSPASPASPASASVHRPNALSYHDGDFVVGEVFLRCNAHEVVRRVGAYACGLARKARGFAAAHPVPEIVIEGHLDTTFPYILSHLEYIIGELLRNSIEATIERHSPSPSSSSSSSLSLPLSAAAPPTATAPKLPPIHVLICNAPKHVIFRVSDQGGGISPDETSDLWSFAKSKRSDHARLRNFAQVPKMAGTLQELNNTAGAGAAAETSSLHTLTYRPPDLKLGMGLPMTRVYAEYWGGSLEQTSIEGFGTDVYLHIEKLGNRLEQLNIDQL